MTTALARNTDPDTSHIAAEKAMAFIPKQLTTTLAAVQENAKLTARELSNRTGLDYYMLCRRLPELRDEGLVCNGKPRRDTSTNRLMQTWNPSERLF